MNCNATPFEYPIIYIIFYKTTHEIFVVTRYHSKCRTSRTETVWGFSFTYIMRRHWPQLIWLIYKVHYNDVIMGSMASQITSLTIVYSAICSGLDRRKHQSSASLASVRGIHRGPVNSPHKWPVTRKMFPFDDVIMIQISYLIASPRRQTTVQCRFNVVQYDMAFLSYLIFFSTHHWGRTYIRDELWGVFL